jgi:hypothetical protein
LATDPYRLRELVGVQRLPSSVNEKLDSWKHVGTTMKVNLALRGFLHAAGWAADGSTRDLDTGELAHQVRLHTSIADFGGAGPSGLIA